MTETQLLHELSQLRGRLVEAEETLYAIRDGEVDALVISEANRQQVVTLESADRPYRVLIEEMNQGVMTLSSEGRILYCNRRMAEMLRRPPEQLLGVALDEFVESASWSSLSGLLREGRRTRVQGEGRLRAADGTAVPVYLAINSLCEGAARLCLIVTDLTEQKRHEELVAAENLASSILEQAVEAMVVCDDTSTIIRANPAACRLAGHNPLWGQLETFFPLQLSSETLADRSVSLASVWRGEAIRGLAVCLQREGEPRRDLLLSAGPLREGQGRIHGCVLTLTDVTERRQAEQALRRMEETLRRQTEQLVVADRRKDEFLAVLAHELRNPLAAILNAAHLLNFPDQMAGTSQEVHGVIERQVSHMTRLVDDLLDVSRIARGKVRLQKQRFNLADLVRTTVEDRRGLFLANGLSLLLELPETPLWIMADPTRLSQVLTNLLQNATKFTDRGGQVVVTLAADPEGSTAVVTVRDTGIGMDSAMLTRVFEPFSQADRSLDRSRGGLGLGLALVKGLIQLHGGTVTAASPGLKQGTTITICLPLDRQGAETAPAQPAAPNSRTRRILVIEDHRDTAESTLALLQMLGHEVAVAYNGTDGVALASEFRPEVVLCDLGLPGTMDGFGVARALRLQPATATAYLVALTGYGQDDDLRSSQQAGFDFHMLKPFELTALQQLLESALGRLTSPTR